MKKTQIKKIEKKEILKNPKISKKENENIENTESKKWIHTETIETVLKMEKKNWKLTENLFFLNNSDKKQNLRFLLERHWNILENRETFNTKYIETGKTWLWIIETKERKIEKIYNFSENWKELKNTYNWNLENRFDDRYFGLYLNKAGVFGTCLNLFAFRWPLFRSLS